MQIERQPLEESEEQDTCCDADRVPSAEDDDGEGDPAEDPRVLERTSELHVEGEGGAADADECSADDRVYLPQPVYVDAA